MCEVEIVVKRIANWKCQEADCIQGFLMKYLSGTWGSLKRIFQNWIETKEKNNNNNKKTMEKTFLLYKKGNPEDPANYRPITWMNVIFKIFTSILKIKIEKRLKKNEIPLNTFQFGSRKRNIGIKTRIVCFKQQQGIVFEKRREQRILKCVMTRQKHMRM